MRTRYSPEEWAQLSKDDKKAVYRQKHHDRLKAEAMYKSPPTEPGLIPHPVWAGVMIVGSYGYVGYDHLWWTYNDAHGDILMIRVDNPIAHYQSAEYCFKITKVRDDYWTIDGELDWEEIVEECKKADTRAPQWPAYIILHQII